MLWKIFCILSWRRLYPMTIGQCPVCKSDMYLNPGIVIYMSPCFHRLCESCMYRIFDRGQAPCPECGTMLRRVNYTAPTFEDIQVERECRIRRVLQRSFLREETEFDNDETKYNDYLEEFENFVFVLLGLRNESLVKERMKKVQDMGEGSVLNSIKNMPRKTHERSIPEKILRSMEEAQSPEVCSEYFDTQNLPRIAFVSKKNLILPRGLFVINDPGGLTQETILSLAISSLYDMNI